MIGRFGPAGLVFPDGRPATSQAVLVALAEGNDAAPIFGDIAGVNELANPITTDALGNLMFYAEVGSYDLLINGVRITVAVDPLGSKGDKGDPGDPGDKGDPGEPGEPGEDGQDGASAYELAVADGWAPPAPEDPWMWDPDTGRYYATPRPLPYLEGFSYPTPSPAPAQAGYGVIVGLPDWTVQQFRDLGRMLGPGEVLHEYHLESGVFATWYTGQWPLVVQPMVQTWDNSEPSVTPVHLCGIPLPSPAPTEAAWLASLEGADGADGANGLSAYELAVRDQGFIGTEEEWLASLVPAGGGGLPMIENRFSHRAHLACSDTVSAENWHVTEDPDGLISYVNGNLTMTKPGLYYVQVALGYESAYSSDLVQGQSILFFRMGNVFNEQYKINYPITRPNPPSFGDSLDVVGFWTPFAAGDTLLMYDGRPEWFGVPVYGHIFVYPVAVAP